MELANHFEVRAEFRRNGASIWVALDGFEVVEFGPTGRHCISNTASFSEAIIAFERRCDDLAREEFVRVAPNLPAPIDPRLEAQPHAIEPHESHLESLRSENNPLAERFAAELEAARLGQRVPTQEMKKYEAACLGMLSQLGQEVLRTETRAGFFRAAEIGHYSFSQTPELLRFALREFLVRPYAQLVESVTLVDGGEDLLEVLGETPLPSTLTRWRILSSQIQNLRLLAGVSPRPTHLLAAAESSPFVVEHLWPSLTDLRLHLDERQDLDLSTLGSSAPRLRRLHLSGIRDETVIARLGNYPWVAQLHELRFISEYLTLSNAFLEDRWVRLVCDFADKRWKSIPHLAVESASATDTTRKNLLCLPKRSPSNRMAGWV